MKKLLIIAMIIGCTSGFAQNRRSNFTSNSSINTGLGLTLGGIGLTVAGFATPITYTDYTTSGKSTGVTTGRQQLPAYRQIRTYPIVTGITITISGLITLAATGKK